MFPKIFLSFELVKWFLLYCKLKWEKWQVNSSWKIWVYSNIKIEKKNSEFNNIIPTRDEKYNPSKEKSSSKQLLSTYHEQKVHKTTK